MCLYLQVAQNKEGNTHVYHPPCMYMYAFEWYMCLYWLCMHVLSCMVVCMSVCIYIYICIYMYIYMCVCVCVISWLLALWTYEHAFKHL